MKTLFALVLLLCSVLAIEAQSYRMKANNVKSSNAPNNDREYQSWSNWTKTSIICSTDFDNGRLKIFNEYGDDFLLNGEATIKKDLKDVDGDSYNNYSFGAIDQDAIECDIIISIWRDYNIVQLGIYYTNFRYVYQCEIIK